MVGPSGEKVQIDLERCGWSVLVVKDGDNDELLSNFKQRGLEL